MGLAASSRYDCGGLRFVKQLRFSCQNELYRSGGRIVRPLCMAVRRGRILISSCLSFSVSQFGSYQVGRIGRRLYSALATYYDKKTGGIGFCSGATSLTFTACDSRLPDNYALIRCEVKGVATLNVEVGVEEVEQRQLAVHAELACRVRVGHDLLHEGLFADAACPYA